MRYRPLFEISITHGYYTDPRCPDVRVVPGVGCAALLSRHRLVLKPGKDGIVVLTPVDAAGRPLVPLAPAAALTFDLRVENDDFPLFTELTAITTKRTPVYTNAGMPAPGGELSLVDRDAGRLPRSTLAMVEITGADSLLPAMTPANFKVRFTPKSGRWLYYVVSDAPAGSAGAFRISDGDPAPPGPSVVFNAGDARDLVASPDASDPVAAALAARYPTMRRLRFVSGAAVTSSERARRYLELHLDGVRALESLPNPSLRSFARVGLGAPPVMADAWYCVIEHRAAGLAARAA